MSTMKILDTNIEKWRQNFEKHEATYVKYGNWDMADLVHFWRYIKPQGHIL